ncbi:MAG: hypothetical protein KBS35_00480 [Mycoplasma sp.]|nr:hypothetical protein [Candidatus Hennigella equi]
MKNRKWLFTIPIIASATCAASCGNSNVITYEDVVDAIFGPHDGKPETEHPGCETYYDCLKGANAKELEKELLYAIYAPLFYLPSDGLGGKSIYDLWKDETLVLAANISECSIEAKDNKVTANFRGYMNFIFMKEYNPFVKNDFLQFTILIDKEDITPEGTNWYLHFIDKSQQAGPECWGFLQAHLNDSTTLFYITYIGYEPDFNSYPHNWHNWKAAA